MTFTQMFICLEVGLITLSIVVLFADDDYDDEAAEIASCLLQLIFMVAWGGLPIQA